MKNFIYFVLLILMFSCNEDEMEYDLASPSLKSTTSYKMADKIFWDYNQNSGFIKTYLATGIGSFNSSYQTSSGSTLDNTRLYFADVTGDGIAEKIYWNREIDGGKVRTYLANGYGNYSASYTFSSGSSLSETFFYFADVTGNGKADKIYWNKNVDGGKVRVYPATSNGNFSSTYISSSGSTQSITQFFFTDVTGDGKADKIYWNRNIDGGEVRVYSATSDGNFSSTYTSSGGSSLNATQLFFADITGNGKADKIYWSRDIDGGKVRVFPATSNGNFSSTYTSSSGSSLAETRFRFADITGNGKADKIYWNRDVDGGKIRVYPATSNGNFSNDYVYSDGSTSTSVQFYFVNVNND